MAVCKSDKRLDEADKIYGEYFKTHCCDGVTLYPGLLALLHKLKDDGYTLGVVTNKPHEASCIVVDTLMGNNIFSIIRGQIDGKPRKPEPAIIADVTCELGFSIHDCLFVGDSEVDVLTGLNSGIDTVLCKWGFRSEDDLIRAGAVNLVNTAEELERFIYNEI